MDDVCRLLDEMDAGGGPDIVAIDLETRGVDAWRPDDCIVGFGLAWRAGDTYGARYFNWAEMDDAARAHLLFLLGERGWTYIAHNALFEISWLDQECAELGVPKLKWSYCTYGLFKQLASEGWSGQSHGLKTAMVELLSWRNTNEVKRDEWLLSRGYHKQGPKLVEGESPFDHLRKIREWVAVNPETRRGKVTPELGEMWRVPPLILGEYCILDCFATILLFEEVLWPALWPRFQELEEFHRSDFIHMDRLLGDSTRRGIPIDVEKMSRHADYLDEMRRVAIDGMRASPLGPHIERLEMELRAEKYAAEPAKFLVFNLGKEPSRFTTTGAQSKNWGKWCARRDKGPDISKNWIKWRDQVEAIRRGEVPEYNFNPDSTDHLKYVLYDSGIVEWRPTERTSYKKGKQIPVFEINGVNGWVDLVATESGELPTSGDLYTQLPPEIGAPLQLFADATQELSYADTYVKLAHLHEDGIWRIHPGWISPGTKTLRLAGGGTKREVIDRRGKSKKVSINLAQIPKTIQFMECLYCEPGRVWFEADWSSVEPHVLAEISRDPALLKLYGPGAKKHDVYLYSGTGYAVFGEQVRAHYDVDNPDVPAAKKALKELRDKVLKKTVLGKQYGAMWRKLLSAYRLDGYVVTPEQAQQISDSHDEMYKVSGREFRKILESEWEVRGGFILSAHGFPTPLDEKRRKDVINSVVQRSAHDCHTMFVARLDRRLCAEGVEFDWVIPDFHDQLIGSCREEDGERVLDLIRDEVEKFNRELNTHVRLKLEPKLSTQMAHAKEAEVDWTKHAAELISKFPTVAESQTD